MALGATPVSDAVRLRACEFCLNNIATERGYGKPSITSEKKLDDKDVEVKIYMPEPYSDPEDMETEDDK